MLFREKHVPAVSRILSLNPLDCALGLLKLINSVRLEMRLISTETRACLFAMFSLMVDRPRARVGLGLNCYVIVFKSFSNLSG